MNSIPNSKFQIPHSKRGGFSLIELSIVIVFVGVVSVVAVTTLWSSRSKTEIDSSAKQIVALLREAQSRSVAQEDNSVWGVYFENSTATTPFYALFKGSSYSSSSVVTRKILPGRVQFPTSSISSGGTLTITFTKTSGIPSTSTSISLQLTTGQQAGTGAGVNRDSSGKIFFDDFNRSNL